MKRESSYLFKRNEFVLSEFETINNAAYWNYQRERIYVKSPNKPALRRRRDPRNRDALIPNTTIEYSRPSSCPTCRSQPIYKHGKKSRIVVDLRFMQHGIKRWITRYIARRYRCPSCGRIIHPHDRKRLNSRYGPNLVAYAIYQNIELGLPQNRVALSIKEMFGLDISRSAINRFKAAAAQAYDRAYGQILERLCTGRLLHVDETSAGVLGKEGYVWVLTSLEEVAYFYTPTRSGDTIQGMLRDFSGVLVTDFYAVYDTIQCPQQKCVIHFIRDLNEELLNHPYDDGLKQLAGAFAGLVKPMIETVDLRGLKKRFLGKHRLSVDRFYKLLTERPVTSEAVTKIIGRLQKSRNTMFTFLDFDDVPWNNNNAEHAIKAFASLRRVFAGTTTEKGLRESLILLSLCETCKYKNVSFLSFLRSGSKDVDGLVSRGRSSAAIARLKRISCPSSL